jgi:TonB family protein
LFLLVLTGKNSVAQIKIAVRTTSQSFAITENTGISNDFSMEIIEAYESEDVDEPPVFPGGNNALIRYINSSRRYPPHAYNQGIHGRVLCSFIVQPDGQITHINVIRGVEPSLNREAIRLINNMPRWHAGRLNGVSVPVVCILPITFRL